MNRVRFGLAAVAAVLLLALVVPVWAQFPPRPGGGFTPQTGPGGFTPPGGMPGPITPNTNPGGGFTPPGGGMPGPGQPGGTPFPQPGGGLNPGGGIKPGGGGPIFESVWTCNGCSKEVGRGSFPPAKCPHCGVKLINGIGGGDKPANPQPGGGFTQPGGGLTPVTPIAPGGGAFTPPGGGMPGPGQPGGGMPRPDIGGDVEHRMSPDGWKMTPNTGPGGAPSPTNPNLVLRDGAFWCGVCGKEAARGGLPPANCVHCNANLSAFNNGGGQTPGPMPISPSTGSGTSSSPPAAKKTASDEASPLIVVLWILGGVVAVVLKIVFWVVILKVVNSPSGSSRSSGRRARPRRSRRTDYD